MSVVRSAFMQRGESSNVRRHTTSLADFRKVYDRVILDQGFFEEPEYYHLFWERYFRTFGYIESIVDGASPRILDIGSGQFAVLCANILGAKCDVADIDTRHTDVLRENGLGFVPIDLTKEAPAVSEPYDLVVMAEVIEHVPRPPHLVFADLRSCLRPGGALLVTTPNLYRFRNVVRMIRGQKIFDYFLLPEKDKGLGHFVEYSLEQLDWQMKHAGYEVVVARIDQLDHGGTTAAARVARQLLRPVHVLRPILRDNLVLVGRRPS
jgi:2-polyprenyl-3-methyl-5-hydroxy-6-metoxy-1,4-benzoquinol methylase